MESCAPIGSSRLADPLGLVARGSIWYLVVSGDDQLRTYRVSRIREAMLDDQESVTPDNFDLAAYWETSTVESASVCRATTPRFCSRHR
jgi:predicted DNA-binding transcriptional regulator YafY